MKLSYLLEQLQEIIDDPESGITIDSAVIFSHGEPTNSRHLFVCHGLGVAEDSAGQNAMFFDLLTLAENHLFNMQNEAQNLQEEIANP